jgi:hypothetical protein
VRLDPEAALNNFCWNCNELADLRRRIGLWDENRALTRSNHVCTLHGCRAVFAHWAGMEWAPPLTGSIRGLAGRLQRQAWQRSSYRERDLASGRQSRWLHEHVTGGVAVGPIGDETSRTLDLKFGSKESNRRLGCMKWYTIETNQEKGKILFSCQLR